MTLHTQCSYYLFFDFKNIWMTYFRYFEKHSGDEIIDIYVVRIVGVKKNPIVKYLHICSCWSALNVDITLVDKHPTRQAWADDRPNISHNFPKIIKVIECHYYIWNHREKCFQISTNMPGIGSVISDIAFEMLIILRKQRHGKLKAMAAR